MPFNVNAKEWQPPSGLLAKLKLRSGTSDGISSNIPIPGENATAAAGHHPKAPPPPPPPDSDSYTSRGSSDFNRTIEEELDFEEMFERASGNNSAHSTPRVSLVGPSPLPSPAASPQTRCPLLSITEASTLAAALNAAAAAAAGGGGGGGGGIASTSIGTTNGNGSPFSGPSSLPNPSSSPLLESSLLTQLPSETLNLMTAVTTHVETEASAAAASAAGGHRRLGPNDFDLLRVVGQGAFGKVFQVRKRDTGEVFAMKVMRKDRIIERDHGEYVRAERDALTAVVHPYIVTLRYSFQTPTKLYLVLDFINGGHLFFQLYRAGIFDEPLAKLYTAELVLAVTHLHSLGFVHRDLKPENVLLDSEGHVKVTDFGLAKGNMSDAEDQRSNSFIGTMEYMAPEVIAGRGHGKAVDWWSVGVLLYEMLCGVPPFRAKSRPALQKLITSAKVKLPNYLSSEATNFLKGLLTKDAPKRLGFGPNGSKDIMNHAFFKGVVWNKLEARQVLSPFRPTIRSHDSVENFDKIWTDLPVRDSPCPTPVESRSVEEASAFEGFTYCAPSMLLAQFAEERGIALKSVTE